MSGKCTAFPEIVKDCPKMRNRPKIFLISFENVDPGSSVLPYMRSWNDLSEDVTSAESLTTFQHLLKTHLFRESFPDCLLDIN